MHNPNLHLKITAAASHTVLPRCLQVLSRRRFTLKALLTRDLSPSQIEMHCTVQGPLHWHDSLPGLLTKTAEVYNVERVTEDE